MKAIIKIRLLQLKRKSCGAIMSYLYPIFMALIVAMFYGGAYWSHFKRMDKEVHYPSYEFYLSDNVTESVYTIRDIYILISNEDKIKELFNAKFSYLNIRTFNSLSEYEESLNKAGENYNYKSLLNTKKPIYLLGFYPFFDQL